MPTDEKSSHYALNVLGVACEVKDVLFAALSPDEYRGWLKGNILTGVMRHGKKDKKIRESEKHCVYSQWLREFEEIESSRNPTTVKRARRGRPPLRK